MNDARPIAPGFGEDDLGEGHVRPQQLDDFVGQPALRLAGGGRIAAGHMHNYI